MLKQYRFFRHSRLLSTAQFQAVFKAKQRQFSPFFVFYQQSNGFEFSRLGVVISKRQVKRANRRNRIRRVIKETFRLSQHQLAEVDWVIVVLKRADSADNQELRQCLQTIFDQSPRA